MSRIVANLAALALLVVLALAGSANAAERRADGMRAGDQAITDVSAYRRFYRRGYWGGWAGRPYWRARYAGWGPRFAYAGYPFWRPRYAWGYGYPYWRPRFAFYRPFWRPWRVGYGHGFYGRRWGW